MDMMIKDYLELNFFSWKYIKENKDHFINETPALKENIDESDFEDAIIDEDITNANQIIHDHQEQTKVLAEREIFLIKRYLKRFQSNFDKNLWLYCKVVSRVLKEQAEIKEEMRQEELATSPIIVVLPLEEQEDAIGG